MNAGFAVAKFCPTTSPTSVSVEFQQLLSVKKDDIIDVEIFPQEPDSKLDLTEKRFVIQRNDKRLATIRLMDGDSKPNGRANRRFPEITGKDNLTVFSYSGRVKSPEWRRQLRRADLRQF